MSSSPSTKRSLKPSQPLASQPPLAQNPPPTELAPLQPAAPVSAAAATTVPEAKPVASQPPQPPQSPNRKRKSVSLNHTQDLQQDSMATSSTAPAESSATNANASASAPAPAPVPASVPASAPAPPPQVEAGAQEPKLKKSRTNTPWTPAEELRLKQMRDKGHSWNEIAQTFPQRTEGSVKKHWYKDMHYAEFAEDESTALLAAIKEYDANKWKVIGQKVGKPAKACEQYAKEHFGGKY